MSESESEKTFFEKNSEESEFNDFKQILARKKKEKMKSCRTEIQPTTLI